MTHITISVRNLRALKHLLKRYQVSFEGWGTGPTKSVRELWAELVAGESTLELIDTDLVRCVHRAQAVIYYDSPNGRLVLRETCQVFANGEVRKRDRSISVSEKCQKGERMCKTLLRGLHEELDITLTSFAGIRRDGRICTKPAKPSTSYPGLQSRHRIARFLWVMPHEYFRPEGYIEVQPDKKTTFFKWFPV